MKKRLTALLLTLVMVLSLFPTTVFATGRGTQIGGKETVLSWRANRRSSESGLQVTVTGSGLSGKELSVDVLKDAEAEKYFNAIESAGNTLVNPMALDIKILNEGAEWQPAGNVQVTITRAGASLSDKVYHFVPLTLAETIGEEAESADAAAAEELTIEELASSTTGETATVDTRHFSVYVIGDAPVHNRVTVNFKNGNETIATMYVKEGDIVNGAVSNVVLNDPGVGDLDDKEVFLGWIRGADGEDSEPTFTEADSGNGLGFDEVRKDIVEKDFATALTADGKVVNYYALVYRAYKVTYLGDDDAVVRSDELLIPAYTGETVFKGADGEGYVVNANYTPDSVHNFEGWKTSDSASFTVQNEAEGVITETDPDDPTKTITVYKNGVAKLFVTGDIVFYVNAPAGHWLVFDENGKGGTYNAPQFVKSGEKTSSAKILPMERNGYTFVDWYTEKYDDDATPDESKKFTFGNELNVNTTIYAKWTPKATANYTVIIYQENLAGDDYDLVESKVLSGTVGETINIQTGGSGNNTYAIVGGENKRYEGFSLRATNPIDTGVKIKAEGDSVVRIYYDRNEYTLTFQIETYGYTYTPTTGNYGTQYGFYNGEYVRIYYNNGTWYRTRTGNNYSNPYTGTRYTRSYGQSWHWETVYTITAKYATSIANEFPISGYTNYSWWAQGSSYFGDAGITKADIMPAENVTFHGEASGTAFRLEYYVQPTNLSTNHADYELIDRVLMGTTSTVLTYNEEFMERSGFLRETSTPEFVYDSNYGLRIIEHNGDNPMVVKMYYTRATNNITFMDGVYVSGRDVAQEETSMNIIGEVANVAYGSSLAAYQTKEPKDVSSNANFKNPTGYVFEGWYIDEGCIEPYDFANSTMPNAPLTVYAKWRQIEYRVFLHPNVPESDTTLAWGLDENGNEQAMNFRIAYGKKVSAPTGTRTGYEFGGWFKDEALTVPFSAEYTNLDEQSVTADYDKTVDMTDPMNKYGNGATWNSDVQDEHGNARNRFWITKKLDLYALWRKTVEGADGIGVEYDLNGGSGSAQDTKKYQDATPAIAAAAPTAPQNKQFEYWVVQTWNGTAYVDATDSSGNLITVYPGKSYTVLKDYCKIVVSKWENPENKNDVITVTDPQPGTTAPDSTHTKINEATYTLRLRAFYKDVEEPTPTYIDWFKNDGVATAPIRTDTEGANGPLQINEGVLIEQAPTREGYTFLGWARMPEFEGEIVKDENGNITNEKVANYTLYEDDLYIKWDAEHSKWLAKDADGNWTVEATKVAADEADPYQAFYAVWQGYFYVYYTGATKLNVSGNGNTVVRVPITSLNADGYDLTAPIDTSSCLYGGYFTDYANKSTDFDATALTYDANNFAKDTNGTAYNGTKCNWGDPYTAEPGNAITPVAGTVYYVKEVPAASYMQPYFHYTYYLQGEKISSAWLVTNVDDYFLDEYGFLFVTRTENDKKNGTLVKTLTVKTEHGSSKETLTSSNVFKVPGYLAYVTVKEKGNQPIAGFVGSNVLQYWKTPDGLYVTGTAIRIYTSVEQHKQIVAGETSRDSVIANSVDDLNTKLAKALFN